MGTLDTLDIVTTLATQEAIAAGYTEITPVRLLISRLATGYLILFNAQAFHDVSAPLGADKTVLHFDYSPLAARRFIAGQQLLDRLHVRMPELPVFLFSLEDDATGRAVDDKLLRAYVHASGARGMMRTVLGGSTLGDWEHQRHALRGEIEMVAQRLRRERMAAELACQNQVWHMLQRSRPREHTDRYTAGVLTSDLMDTARSSAGRRP